MHDKCLTIKPKECLRRRFVQTRQTTICLTLPKSLFFEIFNFIGKLIRTYIISEHIKLMLITAQSIEILGKQGHIFS